MSAVTAGLGTTAIGLLFVALVVAAIKSSIVIVDAYEQKAYTRFGEYQRLLKPGYNFVWPFVSKTYSFDMRTQTIDVPRQEAITRDNSPVTADAVVYIKVMDAKLAFLEVEDHKKAVTDLAQTTLRAVLGDMELDDTLNKRQEINAKIRKELDAPTDEWGIKVESVEVREVNPSPDVQEAMEEQTSAERRRRAMILEAQGERRSAVEEAQGSKEAEIIRAQGKKQSQILEAQGDSISTILRAKSAKAMDERAVIEKSLESLEEIGSSESTTFVLPQELSSLVGRSGKHLSGSDVQGDGTMLESVEFDDDERELLGLDSIDEVIGELEEGVEVDGEDGIPDPDDLSDPEEVVDQTEVDVEEGATDDEE